MSAEKAKQKNYLILDKFSKWSRKWREVSLTGLLGLLARRFIHSDTFMKKRYDVEATITELYVLATFFFAFGLWLCFLLSDALSLFDFETLGWMPYVFVGWGFFRIFEMTGFNVDALLFEEYREGKRTVKDANRYLVLILMNYAELVFLYAFIYRVFIIIFEINVAHSNLSVLCLSFSFFTMTSFGLPPMNLVSDWGQVLILTQSAIGLFMVLIALAFAMGILKEPIVGSQKHAPRL